MRPDASALPSYTPSTMEHVAATITRSGGTPRIAYQPALDGVRALAVVAVLLFHAGVPGFDGGYLGVSVFFTLSGYLITSLLLSEFDTTGRIDLGAFYARRMRRLLPASVLCVAVIVVLAWLTDWFDARQLAAAAGDRVALPGGQLGAAGG